MILTTLMAILTTLIMMTSQVVAAAGATRVEATQPAMLDRLYRSYPHDIAFARTVAATLRRAAEVPSALAVEQPVREIQSGG